MKPTTTEKATARPWAISKHFIISEDMKIADFAVSNALTESEMQANAALIVKTVNEHDLLNAVAEAAKPFLTAPPDTYYICPDASGVGCIGENLRKAIAALKSFREGGK